MQQKGCLTYMKIVSIMFLSVSCVQHFVSKVIVKEILFVSSGNPKTIHRDVKAANILIDNSYEAKVF